MPDKLPDKYLTHRLPRDDNAGHKNKIKSVGSTGAFPFQHIISAVIFRRPNYLSIWPLPVNFLHPSRHFCR
jgi:hypothetical protein